MLYLINMQTLLFSFLSVVFRVVSLFLCLLIVAPLLKKEKLEEKKREKIGHSSAV